MGCSRNVRTSTVASSSRSRAGEYAEADSPMARPVTTGSTPLRLQGRPHREAEADVDPPPPYPAQRRDQQGQAKTPRRCQGQRASTLSL